MLWWLNNNKAYIEAYDEEYGSSVSSTVVEGLAFDRPSYEFLSLYYNGTLNRAPVFEFFKSNFPDRGSWNSAGVNWFIAGNTKNLLTPNIKGFPGFFFNVFDKTDIIAKDSPRQPNCEIFNEFVIDALLNGKALGFNVLILLARLLATMPWYFGVQSSMNPVVYRMCIIVITIWLIKMLMEQ